DPVRAFDRKTGVFGRDGAGSVRGRHGLAAGPRARVPARSPAPARAGGRALPAKESAGSLRRRERARDRARSVRLEQGADLARAQQPGAVGPQRRDRAERELAAAHTALESGDDALESANTALDEPAIVEGGDADTDDRRGRRVLW